MPDRAEHHRGHPDSPDGEAAHWKSGRDDEADLDYDDRASQEDRQTPARLRLPIELELRILELSDEFHWEELWLDIRPMCKAWCEYVESLARRKWLRRAYLHFHYKRYTTGRTAGPSTWTFQRVEDDGTAVFRDVKNTASEDIATHCKRVARPDIVFGYNVFKVNVPGLVLDYDALTARVPWRALVARVCAEERAVQVTRVKQDKIAPGAVGGSLFDVGFDLLQRNLTGWEDAYTLVHKSRAENANDGPRELKRLGDMRYAMIWRTDDDDDDDVPLPGVVDVEEDEY